MSVKDRVRDLTPKLVGWRQFLHSHPELAFDEHETAAFIAGKLREFGLEVTEGIGGTGVVGVLRGGNGPMVGLRADIDALPITEATGLPYASVNHGRMHACGHDGHTAMLLGAARILSEAPPSNGSVVFIFQPAEENEGGGKAMVEAGLFRDFPVASWAGQQTRRPHARASDLLRRRRQFSSEPTAAARKRKHSGWSDAFARSITGRTR